MVIAPRLLPGSGPGSTGGGALLAPGVGSPRPGCAGLASKSGWTSWLPQDTTSYPQFKQGQAAAWTELNQQAQADIPAGGTTVRDVWTGAAAPTDGSLSGLQSEVLQVGNWFGADVGDPASVQLVRGSGWEQRLHCGRLEGGGQRDAGRDLRRHKKWSSTSSRSSAR